MTDLSPLATLSPHRAASIDPGWLTGVLREAGWELIGEREGEYRRFAPPPEGGDASLLVPLNPASRQFEELMRGTLAELSAHGRLWDRLATATRLLDTAPAAPASGTVADRADTFLVHKEVEAPAGLVPWRDGERLIAAVGDMLRAGAKAFVRPQRRFSNQHGRFANAFLDRVFMGQTRPGSYIVTAYAPTRVLQLELPLEPPVAPGTEQSPASFPDTHLAQAAPENHTAVRAATGRQITRSVAVALGAAVEALDHYRRRRSLSGFDAGVRRGISRELTDALHGIVDRSGGADIALTWDPESPEGGRIPTRFPFEPEDAQALAHASTLLSAPGAPEPTTVIGRPYQLTVHERESPNVIGIKTLGAGERRFRARFDESADSDAVIDALRAGHLVHVTGDAQREGNVTWLYRARLLQVLGHAARPLPGEES